MILQLQDIQTTHTDALIKAFSTGRLFPLVKQDTEHPRPHVGSVLYGADHTGNACILNHSNVRASDDMPQ